MNKFLSAEIELKKAKVADRMTINRTIQKLKNSDDYKKTFESEKNNMISQRKEESMLKRYVNLMCINFCINRLAALLQKNMRRF